MRLPRRASRRAAARDGGVTSTSALRAPRRRADSPDSRREREGAPTHKTPRHAWAWTRDCERLDALWARSDRCPLGSGALAGHPFFGPEERDLLAKDLQFGQGPTQNSLDSVSDRDFAIEFVQRAAASGMSWVVALVGL